MNRALQRRLTQCECLRVSNHTHQLATHTIWCVHSTTAAVTASVCALVHSYAYRVHYVSSTYDCHKPELLAAAKLIHWCRVVLMLHTKWVAHSMRCSGTFWCQAAIAECTMWYWA
eukprot:19584-Heterococcus_DN1.PRE.1